MPEPEPEPEPDREPLRSHQVIIDAGITGPEGNTNGLNRLFIELWWTSNHT